jgi:hypothetical protein
LFRIEAIVSSPQNVLLRSTKNAPCLKMAYLEALQLLHHLKRLFQKQQVVFADVQLQSVGTSKKV